jgi:hypothetical protein
VKQHGSATYERLNIGKTPAHRDRKAAGHRAAFSNCPLPPAHFRKGFAFVVIDRISVIVVYYYPAKIARSIEKDKF